MKFINLIFFFWTFGVYAQRLVVDEFSQNGNIPTSELYDISEDRLGNKWIASDVGVIKVSGTDVRVFNMDCGLPENTVLKVVIDSQQRIWGIGLTGILFFIKHDTVCIPFVGNYKSRFKTGPLVKTFSIGPNGEVKLSLSQPYFITLRLVEISDTIFKAVDDLNYFDVSNGCYDILVIGTDSIVFKDKPLSISDIFGTAFFDARRICGRMNEITFFITSLNKLSIIKSGLQDRVIQLPYQILCATYINQMIFIGTRGGGIFTVDSNYNITQMEGEIAKLSISKIVTDNQKIIWVTTLEKGLFLIKSSLIQLEYITDNTIYNLVSDKAGPVAITSTNEIIAFNTISKSNAIVKTQAAGIIKSIYRFNIKSTGLEGKFTLSSNGLFQSLGGIDSNIYHQFFHTIIKVNEALYVFLSYYSMYIYNFKYGISIDGPDRIMSGERLSDTSILIATMNKGVFEFCLAPKYQKFTHVGLKDRINDVAIWQHKKYLLASNANGILLFDRVNGDVMAISSKVRMNKVVKWRHLVIGASKNGLHVWNALTQTQQFFNAKNYLPLKYITGMVLNNDLLYVSGTHKVISVPFQFFETYRPQLNIDFESIKVNGVTYDSNRSYRKGDLVRIHILNNNYLLSENILYTVKVFQNHELISAVTTSNKLVDLSLPEGINQIEVVAYDLSLNKYSGIVRSEIKIARAFYKTPFFIAIGIALACLLLFVIVKKIIVRIRKIEFRKREDLVKINKLKLDLLRSQLNPHFIFNSLNSLRDIVRNDTKQKADDYLSRFALLIRKLLNNSLNEVISIKSELDFLTVYIELEKTRYDADVQVLVDCRDDILALGIPSGLAQPIIENIFKHAWISNASEKQIGIHFKLEQDLVSLTIKDNGIGFDTKFMHRNMGLNIVEDRLKLLHKKEPHDFFKIVSTPNIGTSITLVFPKIVIA